MKRAWLVAISLLAAPCGGDDPRIAQQSLSLLLDARRLHDTAVSRVRAGDLEGAVRALQAVAALAFPREAPEGEDIAIDALAEASRVLTEAGRAAAAEAVARRAIARASRRSYFLGLAHLRLGDALRAQGKPREAVLALEKSIRVNRAVMDGRTELGDRR